ncbi:aldehyde dehydrogenase (NAD+) [Exophiala aquamarina CBS 119918]|uniref:aldehyde dehydrogenase (NAD(+)) n=1 Tax=Exophiala aquamarina CBS 119918 TaxID=1182545 RepID=A0A072P3R4_9EURO|nr:aldehyde dehydrogenase (NAD+) [Exophiala aquamarina CBS 119918]KEF54501.1 aldehyde dehydrogenase (NAD+) [Exophiala aquamarina CBS 119918]
MGSVDSTGFDLSKNFYNVINGEKRSSSRTSHGTNPSTMEQLPEAPIASSQDLDKAVRGSRAAFAEWSEVPVEKRKALVNALAGALEAHSEQFARLLTLEQGKPLSLAQGEIKIGVLRARELCNLDLPETIRLEDERRRAILSYSPLGICALIVPWNFPISLATQKIASALVTGNTVILKPSPFTPYCGLKLGELAQQFFPPGVFQVLNGDDELGPWITAHPGIDKISFTGSIATGKRVMEIASRTLKRVTLELGGNDPCIICDDVNIEETVAKVVTISFLNSGQVCIAVKRIYVQENIYDQFLAAFVDRVKTLQLGDGLEDGVFLGPLQNKQQYEIAQRFLSDVESQNLKVALGGSVVHTRPGLFISPTVVDRPPDTSDVVKEELFAPIVPLLSWKNEEEVISRANETHTGLGGSVWSKDIARATRIARKLQVGTAWINEHGALDPRVPFSGLKESGYGTELGIEGLKAFCNSKVIFVPK